MTNQEMRAELARYCLANYENGMDVAVETFDDMDWAIIIGRARGSFKDAVDLLKAEVNSYLEYRSEVEATEF